MKIQREQFRVLSGDWHQSVRTKSVKWLIGACLLNLDKAVVETRTTAEPPTCARCIKALAEHPDLQTGGNEPTATQDSGAVKNAKARNTRAPKRKAAADASGGQGRDAANVKTRARNAKGDAKKADVRREPESPKLF